MAKTQSYITAPIASNMPHVYMQVIDNGEGFRYDKVCEGKMECSIKIPLPSFADGEGDVFVYYGLKNFYQNFKEYVKNENGEIKTSQFNG